ncbi:MAG TPA: peptide chain release factor N(5)-glutamine methyltransferase [Ignavibacteria bacterium]|nr:peptide chain release factor N(5)-glutamine methyltransferase [Ignavibacteria bacterium]
MQSIIPESVIEFLNYSAGILNKKKIKDSRLNAELMLCEVLKCSRVELYLNFEKPLTNDEVQKFKLLLQRRMKYEPLQYILGKTNFFGFDILVNSNVLIPRQETEILAEKVIDDIKSRKMKEVSLFEIGSGSGCLSIAVAKSLISENIKVQIFSIDISDDAVNMSIENLKLNSLDNETVRFYVKDVFEIEKLNKDFDYIISNPPYISAEEFKTLDNEVKDFEPAISLTDNADGLKFYERIFKIASDSSFTGKVFCEIGFGQKNAIEKMVVKNNFTKFRFHKDYSNIYRIIEAFK